MTFAKTGLLTATSTLLFLLATANRASACILGILLCGGGDQGGGGGTAAPEFDGPGAVAAASLLVSIGFLLYNRATR
jgi:hypothetical protein